MIVLLVCKVSTIIQKNVQRIEVAHEGSQMTWSPSILVLKVYVSGSSLLLCLDHLDGIVKHVYVVVARCYMQNVHAIPFRFQQSRTVLHKELDNCHVLFGGSPHQWRPPLLKSLLTPIPTSFSLSSRISLKYGSSLMAFKASMFPLNAT